MTVSLGSIVLDDNLALVGLEEAQDILASQYTSFDGTVETLVLPPSQSRQLSLVASQDGNTIKGIFTLAQINAIKTLSRLGQAVTLTHHRGTFSVLIVSVTNFNQVIGYVDPQDTDWCTATINMIEV